MIEAAETTESPYTPERKLWAHVLGIAIYDAKGVIKGNYEPRAKEIIREGAVAWFKSTNKGACSFSWICDILDLDPGRIRKMVFNTPLSEMKTWGWIGE